MLVSMILRERETEKIERIFSSTRFSAVFANFCLGGMRRPDAKKKFSHFPRDDGLFGERERGERPTVWGKGWRKSCV